MPDCDVYVPLDNVRTPGRIAVPLTWCRRTFYDGETVRLGDGEGRRANGIYRAAASRHDIAVFHIDEIEQPAPSTSSKEIR
jgi:hypothetical protein